MKCPDCGKKVTPIGSAGGTIHTSQFDPNYIFGKCGCRDRCWKDDDPFRGEWYSLEG